MSLGMALQHNLGIDASVWNLGSRCSSLVGSGFCLGPWGVLTSRGLQFTSGQVALSSRRGWLTARDPLALGRGGKGPWRHLKMSC